jgi:hypothetical protein
MLQTMLVLLLPPPRPWGPWAMDPPDMLRVVSSPVPPRSVLIELRPYYARRHYRRW